MPTSWLLFFSLLGFVSFSKLLITFFNWVFITFIRPPKNLKKYGSWALITGATDGIGVTYPVARYFHEVDEDVWMKVMKVNVEGTSLVTKAVIEGMIERKRGAIVNIGSGAAIVVPSHPLYAIYAASKA
ncbi:hypothetical protein E3N88_19912 [Mikania micrantha]|uniref:Uncharacterized protein n=1 Tax=Mikania micrantha TaxID=192012 RepID=A0A5N6NPM9_9ASTR|nr:hypothetical protein E3N88_19912 [Mikania micrantha]